MIESQIIKVMSELTKEIKELRGEIADLKSCLRASTSSPQGQEVPPWLKFEAMEGLARADKPMSTEELAQRINERRETAEEKTSRASVSRAVSELVGKGFVMQKKIGRRIYYELTGKAKVLYTEGRALEEAIKGMTKKVIESEGRKCGAYMMSIITPDTRRDARSIADVILGDEHKVMKGEISMRSNNRYSKSEISLLLLPAV